MIVRCGGTFTAVFTRPSDVVTRSFNVRPPSFSPNGDGRKDTATISAKFTAQADQQRTQTTEVEWILRVWTKGVTVRT